MGDYFTLEMLARLNEECGIGLFDQDGEIVGIYDGKDSIDKKYNGCPVIYFKPLAENQLRVDVYVEGR